MTTRFDLDRSLGAWFRADAGDGTPDYLDEIVDRVASEPQRTWWSSPERWLPMDVTTRASVLAFPRAGRLLLVGLLVLALAALVAYVVGSRPQRLPPPFGPANNGTILSERNGDIYIADEAGDGARPLISGPQADAGPQYTHDGTRFMFLRDQSTRGHVMIADADGSNVRQLTTEPLLGVEWFEFSPGDDQIAIVHGDAGRRVISMLDVASGELTRLDVPGLNVDNNVRWRPPDGRELIFTARVRPRVANGRGDLWDPTGRQRPSDDRSGTRRRVGIPGSRRLA